MGYEEKHYKIGYVSGSFDMFHIGHLNLLRRAKERCDYLIVGVLADECIILHKKRAPIIPIQDRLEIIKSCSYVDEVDITTKELLNKISAWNKYKFDAMFTGDDHKSDGWAWEEPELNELGAEIVFFPYTESVSSTKLRKIVEGGKNNSEKKIITYGTFDLLHNGHIRLLERAKELGDYLIVGVTSDDYDVQRGKLNVIDSLETRIQNVKNLNLADEIIVEESGEQKEKDIKKYGINIFTVGSDWKGKFDYLNRLCDVVYLERTKYVSSTELRELKHKTINIGIVGSGRIAGRTLEELKFVSGINTTSIFNPNKISAEKFANKFELIPYHENYEVFLENVDAVYIATPHETHFEYVKRALLAGKHVLCEKPFVLKEIEAKQLFDLANERKLVLMEAIKTAYVPAFLNLIETVISGKIGECYDIEVGFTKLLNPNNHKREFLPDVGGSFTELASYSLLPIIKLFGDKYNSLSFTNFNDENGIDIYSKAHFVFDNAVATAKTGIGVKSEGQLLISGTKGYILVKSPWWLMNKYEICYENPKDNEIISAPFQGYGMRFEIAEFIKNITNPTTYKSKLEPNESIAMAAIIERFLEYRRNNGGIQ